MLTSQGLSPRSLWIPQDETVCWVHLGYADCWGEDDCLGRVNVQAAHCLVRGCG